MTPYLNLSGTSGVRAYESGPDYIKVQFQNRSIYTYSYRGKAGPEHVEAMKTLASNGRGLGTYINKYVKYLYD